MTDEALERLLMRVGVRAMIEFLREGCPHDLAHVDCPWHRRLRKYGLDILVEK